MGLKRATRPGKRRCACSFCACGPSRPTGCCVHGRAAESGTRPLLLCKSIATKRAPKGPLKGKSALGPRAHIGAVQRGGQAKAAGHRQNLAGDEGGPVAGQEGDGISDVLRAAGAVEGDVFQDSSRKAWDMLFSAASVAVKPGSTALHRTPCRAYCTAMSLVRKWMAALLTP